MFTIAPAPAAVKPIAAVVYSDRDGSGWYDLIPSIVPAVEARPAPEPTGPTEADDLWWAEQTRDGAEAADADWDALADNATAVDALACGYCHA